MYHDEAQGPGGEVRASVTHTWKRNQVTNSGQNFGYYPVSRAETIERDVFPNLVKVSKSFRVEIVTSH